MKDEEVGEKCKKCESSDLTEPKYFNLMMNVNLGSTNTDYGILRPETSQSMFLNYKNILNSMKPKIPFGIAQIGKSFRNEVTTRHFIFRSREFEQMEMIYMVEEKDDNQWFEYWVENRVQWWKKQGVEVVKLVKTDFSHYAKANVDLLYQFPNGLEELEGIHNRSDFDLGSHTKAQDEFDIKSKVIKNVDSNEKMFYLQGDKKIIPNIIETSAGVERAMLAVLSNSFYLSENNKRVLQLPYHLAPVKIAVIPLMKNKTELVEKAKEIVDILKNLNIHIVQLELSSNIGKSYKYHDEIGTPYCITVDFDTLGEQKDTVTIRNRNNGLQDRIEIKNIVDYINKKNNTNSVK